MNLPGIKMKDAVNVVAEYYDVTKNEARRRIINSTVLGWLDFDVAADIQLMARHLEHVRDDTLPDVCVGFVRWFHGLRPGEHEWSYDDELNFHCAKVESCFDCDLYPVECRLKPSKAESK